MNQSYANLHIIYHGQMLSEAAVHKHLDKSSSLVKAEVNVMTDELDGEALDVCVSMPVKISIRWLDLS